MPYQNLGDGLYLIKQKSVSKGVDHFGILDVGNTIRHPRVQLLQPIVIHQRPPIIQMQYLQETGVWENLGRIVDEADAIGRIREALKNPTYNLFGNNCEHFARHVATGKRESHQVQAVVVIAGLLALAYRN